MILWRSGSRETSLTGSTGSPLLDGVLGVLAAAVVMAVVAVGTVVVALTVILAAVGPPRR